MSPAPTRLDPDQLASLEEQRDFLLRSISDLEREHAAGDLDDADFENLRDDYTARAAEVIRAIGEQREAFADARPERSWGRIVAVGGGVAVFAIVAGLLATSALGARKPGESASGGVTVRQTTSQRANECQRKMSTDAEASFECFEEILAEDNRDPVANTWSAWLLSLSADNFSSTDRLTAQALAAVRLDTAVESDPNYSYARAFRAIVAYRNGRFDDAERYLADFRENDPSAEAVQIIEQQGLDAKIAEARAEEAGAAGSDTTTTTAPGG